MSDFRTLVRTYEQSQLREMNMSRMERGVRGDLWPHVDPGPRTASPDLIERAMGAYEFTRPDTQFIRLVNRFTRFMSW